MGKNFNCSSIILTDDENTLLLYCNCPELGYDAAIYPVNKAELIENTGIQIIPGDEWIYHINQQLVPKSSTTYERISFEAGDTITLHDKYLSAIDTKFINILQ
jgi:hypothetical protein